MRFIVAVKQVPNTGDMTVDAEGNLIREGVESILNPYCEAALMKAMALRGPDDTVEAVTMGPGQSEAALRRCLELGADRAYLISDRAFAGADTWATARTLVAFFTRYGCDADLLLFGRQSIDGDTGQVPTEVARLLDVQQFCYTDSLTIEGDCFVAVQDYGDTRRACRVPKGSVISFSSLDLRGALPTARGYMDSLGKEIITLDRVALGLGLYSVGGKGSPTRIVSTSGSTSVRRNRKVDISNPATASDLLIREIGGIE